MKIKMAQIALIFTILCLIFTVSSVFAQEASTAPPEIGSNEILKSAGAPFNVGWNYFTVSATECTVKNIFNELQAAGGGALLVQEIWKEENSQWKMFNVADSSNVKVNSDNIFAFNSNQKFYLNIAESACKTKNTNRDAQIEQVRDSSTKQRGDSFLDKLLSVPGDFWSGLFGKMEINKQENTLTNSKYSGETAVFTTLNVLNKTTVTDLGITGKITQGLLSINGLDGPFASINTLSNDLYLQNQLLGGINILNGKVTIDTSGNIKVQNAVSAKSIEVEQIKITKAVGSSVLPANTTSLEVTTDTATASVKILITPTSLTDKVLSVTNKTDGKFTVSVKQADSQDIQFDWFVIQN